MPGPSKWQKLPPDIKKEILQQPVLHWSDLINLEKALPGCKNILSNVKTENPSRKFSFFLPKISKVDDRYKRSEWNFAAKNMTNAIFSSISDAFNYSKIPIEGVCEVSLTLEQCEKFVTYSPNYIKTFTYANGIEPKSITQYMNKENPAIPNPFYEKDSTASSPKLDK